MLSFRVDDMTCGRCARAITTAVRTADAAARVEVDIPNRLVGVETSAASPAAILAVIEQAGYHPVATGARPAGAAPRAGACGCGGTGGCS